MSNGSSELEKGDGIDHTPSKRPENKQLTFDSDPPTIISFSKNDPDDPYNWSKPKKIYVVILGSLVVINSTISSSLPSLASTQLQSHFNVQNDFQLVLPNSIFLVGYIFGPMLWAPLSENYGRRYIIICTYLSFTIWVLASALAPNWTGFLFFRFLTGFFGSTPISLTGGLFADILENPVWRGRSIAWFMALASFGPALAPIPSGYLALYSWRWPFWFGTIFAGACAVPLLFLPETYGPRILLLKARKMRKEGKGEVYAELEMKHTSTRQLFTQVLGRPLRMMLAEPIVSACCLYLSLIYAIQFMLFQSYSVIFPPIYGFGPGQTGLAFLAIALGNLPIALLFVLWWDGYLRRAKAASKAWAFKEEYQRLPLAILGGPLFAAGLFWIGWGAREDVHWIVPILGGLPLGIGFVLIFVALANYIVDSYTTLSASALGGTSIARSTFGVVLPFAARPMYETLGVAWACSLLGFLGFACCLIPFVFIRYGPALRARSKICQEIARQKAAQAPSDEEAVHVEGCRGEENLGHRDA
ncbi:Major facilitator superfamily multidrug transporter mdrA [Pseudocercospora fuligena]|uniref:Major facilitator superfamily multidrug transporter mdrA n=1 Tax=Pseudocercospora fuligena TaxID=685502 RepID=A0A8H6RKQ4_9PEZI|nr:Major facilitator superfamily multidrug transporter mdrA [Pseudocercospora fuligena]